MVFYEESERIYATIPRSIYKILVEEANENMRSLSSQVAYALKEQYKGKLLELEAQRIHHDKEGEHKIQN